MADVSYGKTKLVDGNFDQVMEKTKEALKAEGFGVLAEIDIQKAMKEKLGLDYPKYTILGACNPPLANKALTAEPLLGLLLPCNVIVKQTDGKIEVGIIKAIEMLGMVGNKALEPIAAEVAEKMDRVLAAV